MKLAPYPSARTEPVDVTVGGITFGDPYLWLEADTDDVLAWQDEQNTIAQSYVKEWTGWSGLLEAVGRELVEASIDVPVVRAGRAFTVNRDRERAVLQVDGRTLVDLNGSASSLDWMFVSPKGRYVAYGLSEQGAEQSVLHVVDADTGEVLPVRIRHTSQCRLSWLPDESGFYFSGGVAPDHLDARKSIFFYEIGAAKPVKEDVPVEIPLGATPQVSKDGRFVALLLYTSVNTYRIRYVLDRESGRWTEALPLGHRQCLGDFVGDRYIAVSKDDAPRGRVVVLGGDVLVPESDAVIEHLYVAGDRLLLEELVDTTTRLRFVGLDGSPGPEVELPGRGTALVVPGDEIHVVFTSLTRSPALYRLDGEKLVVVKPAKRERDDLTMKTIFAGDVPAHLVFRGDLTGPRPAVIVAYGGFNAPLSHGYIGSWVPFVDAGGVYVHAHLRGGGEYGAEWWEAGRMERKQNTFDDLYAVAEKLIADGVTTSESLAVTGGSNGGLMAGVAAVQRPDLFRAVVPRIPFLDLMRAVKDPYPGAAQRLEYGDPEDPEMAKVLIGYSPYHNILPGLDYPAVFLACGASDIRCPIWHARKYAARMQAATTSDRPVLLRAWKDIGHGTGTTASTGTMIAAEPVAFVMRELGL